MEVVKQEGIKDCGVCSLLSIIKHYKGNVSIEYLRELTSTTKNGVTAYKLVQAASIIGFNSYGINMKTENLEKQYLPIISHIIINKTYQHFIVIYDINKVKKELLIMDPAIGKKKISFAEFNLMTSNNFIYMKPIKKILNLDNKKVLNEWLILFLKNNKKYIPYIIILTIIYFILNITSAFYFKLLLNKAINYSIIENVYVISKFFLVLYLLKELTLYLKNITLLKWSELLDEELTKKVLKRLTLLPYLYYKNRTTGEVISRMKDLSVIKSFLIKFISSMLTDVIVLIVFFIILCNINLKLGIISFFITIVLVITDIIVNSLSIRKTKAYLKTEDKINSILYEDINSMSTIKSLHIEKEKLNSFIKEYQLFLEKAYKVNRLFFIDKSSNSLLSNIFLSILLTIGSILIINNKLNIGSLIVFESILNYYLSSLESILSVYKDYSKFKLSKKRIEDLFTINIENFNCLEYFKEYKLNGTIKINNLTYSYGCKNIFNNLCLTIKKKDKIFLTGPSGIGKSTLMKILARFINIDYGNITINNIDLNHYHLDVIRSKITYVSQQESLFTGTIEDNILFNKENNIEKISKLVMLDDLIDNNLGYKKMIEEGGSNFSGGERQRIILARTLVKDSDIYIFDEALNQIDIEKEKQILKNILKYLKNKTVIVISHRLTCLELFNRVLTLKDGKINEKL